MDECWRGSKVYKFEKKFVKKTTQKSGYSKEDQETIEIENADEKIIYSSMSKGILKCLKYLEKDVWSLDFVEIDNRNRIIAISIRSETL